MKKLLSLGLAIVMMLSCVLVQTVAVSAAGAVSSNNAPYAGVYAVTADKATTVTTEAGSVTELAAGVTGYTFLVKGANEVQVSNGANLTITALEDNGKAFYDQVNIPNVLISGTKDTHDVTSNDAIYLTPGQSVTLTHTANQGAGIYYPYLSGTEGGTIRVTSDTGFYADILLRGSSSSAWADGSNKGDPEIVYLKAGEQTITLTNIGSSDAIVQTTRFGTTYPFTANDLWLPQMAMKALKVVPYVAEPEPTPDVPTTTPGTTSYTADLAGVYEVSSDKAVTVTSEIGSVAELEAGETGYIYLLKGANTLNISDDTATLTITALENNGLDYLDQVTAEIPLAPSSISELTLSGNYSNAQHPYTDYGASGVAIGPNGSVDVTLTAPAAGLYVTQIQFSYDTQAQMTVESDTGFYGVINQQAGRVGWNELHQGEHGVGNQDMEIIFLRAGANTITFKNTGAGDTLITKIKMAKTGSLVSLPAYNWQFNVENLKPVAPIVDSFLNDVVAATAVGNTITMGGRIGAEWMDLAYGVEFTTNKTGTRAQKYYGARPGDIVSDGNGGTTTFTFGEWDGTFEIVLEGVSAGVKEYKFFVGDNYSEEATVTVE
ncbi:MAG: hypothetical protein E7413_03335 [Ruminococcaceae bacterium]|nr:hypothetical protein [Oscillospiraceae bacterium]